MKKAELLATHPTYAGMAEKWRFYAAAFEGPDALKDHGVLQQFATEDDKSFEIRRQEAIGFGYSKSIINLYNELLTTKEPERDYGPLDGDKLWARFLDDCDQYNADLQAFLLEQAKRASVYGHIGLLVDKPAVEVQLTQAQAVMNGVYPYIAAFAPQDIMDWRYTKDQWQRPVLDFVKLMEQDGETILIYTRQGWQRWRIKEEGGREMMEPVLDGEGLHDLGVVPFVWLTNRRRIDNYPRRLPMGESDLSIVAGLDASIMRNLSCMDEIAKHGAFPMFRQPTSGTNAETGQQEVAVGPQAVLPFEVREGEAGKPDWLESAAGEPVAAHLSIIEHKRTELYRTANVGGLQVTENSADAKSGVALQHEFRLLNSVLSGKAAELEEAERTVCWLWCKWQGREQDYSGVTIEWPRKFDVEDMAADLENIMALQQAVSGSPTFQRHAKMTAARKLPAAMDDLSTIEKELQDAEAQAAKQRAKLAEMDTGMDQLNGGDEAEDDTTDDTGAGDGE